MSLHSGLEFHEKLGGIFGFSGYLFPLTGKIIKNKLYIKKWTVWLFLYLLSIKKIKLIK
jgi:hypothetical protein